MFTLAYIFSFYYAPARQNPLIKGPCQGAPAPVFLRKPPFFKKTLFFKKTRP